LRQNSSLETKKIVTERREIIKTGFLLEVKRMGVLLPMRSGLMQRLFSEIVGGGGGRFGRKQFLKGKNLEKTCRFKSEGHHRNWGRRRWPSQFRSADKSWTTVSQRWMEERGKLPRPGEIEG